MNFAIARRAGLVALGCCTFTHAYAQDAAPAEGATDTAEPAAEKAPERLIDILNYRVEGNTVLPRTEVERAVMDFMGPQRPTSDVDAARAALEKAYRAKGFETVSVEIPEQDVQAGIIRLDVIENKIGRLRVTDARHVSPERIRNDVPSLAEGQVPNYQAVSRELAALNKSSNRSVTPILRAGDAPGTVDVELNVEDSSPLHGSLEINDRSSSQTERLRVTGSVRYGNLFQADHSLSLQGQLAPQDPGQSWVVSGSYVAPIHGTPLTLVGYGVHSDSDIAAIGGIGVIGSGDIFGLRGIYSFTTGAAASPLVHQVTFGADYKSFKESLILGSDTANTPIDYMPLVLQYSVASRTEKQDIDLSFGLNLGLRGLGADDREFRLKRYLASASWATLRADASYLRRLPHDWRAGVRLALQYAGRPVISNEQFSVGGLDSVRGYYESQVLGDDGAYAQVQLDTPSLHKLIGGAAQEFRLFAFADAGAVRVHLPALDDMAERTRIASVGGGLNLRVFNYLNLSALLAAPLTNRGDAPTDVGALRAQFRLWLDF